MITTPPVDGVVLAAGRSARMGRPKPLLRVNGETFMERAVRRLAGGGCRSVNVVVGASDESVERMARALGASAIRNPDRGSEQIESIRLAVSALPPDSGALMLLPVDVPLVSSTTVRALIGAFHARRPPIVVPVHGGEPGHPVLLSRVAFNRLLNEELPEGLRSLIESYGERVERVVVEDEGILIDIDTPQEYARMSGHEATEPSASG
jgi:molybdenum cofactor cytidylyltransferase